jgi:hypothetical protein
MAAGAALPESEEEAVTELSGHDLRLLYRLVRARAVELGYEAAFTEANRPDWPPELRALSRVAGRLRRLHRAQGRGQGRKAGREAQVG